MPGPTIPDSEESTDTLKLCPPETFVKMYKEKAEEVLCSIHEIENKRETTAFTIYMIS